MRFKNILVCILLLGPVGVFVFFTLQPKPEKVKEEVWLKQVYKNEKPIADEMAFMFVPEPNKMFQEWNSVHSEDWIYRQEPANFITTIEVDTPNDYYQANVPIYAFYKIISEDQLGNKSAVSTMLSAKRPIITSQPLTLGSVGKPYQYTLSTNASKGYWVRYEQNHKPDHVIYTPKEAPEWLTLSEDGSLSGTPAKAGNYTVSIDVSIPDRGNDTQTFTIHVQD